MKRHSENCSGQLQNCHCEHELSCETKMKSFTVQGTGKVLRDSPCFRIRRHHCVLSECYAAQQIGNFRVTE